MNRPKWEKGMHFSKIGIDGTGQQEAKVESDWKKKKERKEENENTMRFALIIDRILKSVSMLSQKNPIGFKWT